MYVQLTSNKIKYSLNLYPNNTYWLEYRGKVSLLHYDKKTGSIPGTNLPNFVKDWASLEIYNYLTSKGVY